jgi:hypothetical protein
MSIRNFALTTAVIAGVLGFTGKADAQVIYTGGYSTPGVVTWPSYTPSYYSTPGGTYTYGTYLSPSYPGWYWDGSSYPYPTGYSYPTRYSPADYSLYSRYSGPSIYLSPRGPHISGRGPHISGRRW